MNFPPADQVATGFQFTEGPVWIPSRAELLFSDIPANRIMCWQDGRVTVWREPSHQANGNTLDPHGRLLTCEHATRRVTRTALDGAVTVLADHYQGRRLNSPNDIKCRRDGTIYFSDPPYGVSPADRELDFQGVFRIVGADLQLVARDFVKPNGLCFSPDESRLYVADTELGQVRVMDLVGGDDRVFCQVERPDGMEVDAAGNLHVAGLTAVKVFDPGGAPVGEIPLPERPANLEFGDADRRTLYVTARTSLYRVRVPIAGL